MSLIMILLSTSVVFAAEVDTATTNANHYGFLTLIPPIVAIVLAFLTKNVIISLFIGTLSGTFLVSLVDNSFMVALVNSFLDFVSRVLDSLADPWNAGIILQVLVIGGVIHLVAKMGGAKAVAEALAKKAKTAKSTQLVTLLLGLAVFFDDYANSLIVGPIMKPVADKMKISRERLAFIIDATAAPIAGLAIVSTWIGLEVGLINDAFTNGVGQQVDAFGVFLQTIPYRFYNILILFFVFITSFLLKDFGPMYKAEIEARRRGLFRDIRDRLGTNNLMGSMDQWTEEEKTEYEEIACINMLHSILTYSDSHSVEEVMQNEYLRKYFDTLGEERVRELALQEIEEFKDAVIDKNSMTDSEGVSYNSVRFRDDKNEAFEHPQSKGPYWYLCKHGIGPGAIPKGVNIVDTIDDEENPYRVYVALDKVLTTDELSQFEMKEAKPPINN